MRSMKKIMLFVFVLSLGVFTFNDLNAQTEKSNIKSLNQSNFNSSIKTGLVLVDFYADWCGPCKMVSPIVDELSEQMNDIKFRKVNVDEENNLAMRYNVRSIPTLVIFKDGQEVDRMVGFAPKARLQTWLENQR